MDVHHINDIILQINKTDITGFGIILLVFLSGLAGYLLRDAIKHEDDNNV